MGNHDGCRTGLPLRNLENIENLSLNGHVQRRGWLIGDDDLRVIRNRNGNNHALTHTTRELVWEALDALLWFWNTHQIKQLNCLLLRLGF